MPPVSRLRPAIDATESHTAILFFSHRPEREWQNKQFVRRDYAKNRRIAESFYQHTLQAARESGLPVLEVTDAQQRGRSFGERLANAFADAFAQGYDRVIAVGNDCPRLHEVDWSAVVEHLGKGTPVLGPTPEQEGAYLIGISRAQFDKQAFAALPWTSSALFAALENHLSEASGTPPILLAPRDDVNGHGDLVALVRRHASLLGGLLGQLRVVLGPVGHATGTGRPISTIRVCRPRSRGPPVCGFVG